MDRSMIDQSTVVVSDGQRRVIEGDVLRVATDTKCATSRAQYCHIWKSVDGRIIT